MKNLFPLLSSFLLSIALSAQPAIEWKKAYGGFGIDWPLEIQQTSDGGYIVAGFTGSNDFDVTGLHGGIDWWIVKLSNTGMIEWQKTFGGLDFDQAKSIKQTSDGGYIVAGNALSTEGDVTGNHGNYDFWVLKLSSVGEIQWEKALGGSKLDNATDIEQTNDGGYIVTGDSESNDGDASQNHGLTDIWVVKLSETGSLQWEKSLGGSSEEYGNDILPTPDGGYIVTGMTTSNDGDVSGNHGFQDIWVVKLNNLGDIQWQKALGGSASLGKTEVANSILPTVDGGYILAATVSSLDGDIDTLWGGTDCWIARLDSTGNLQQSVSLGGSLDDGAAEIQQTSDGGYIVAGYAFSNDGQVSGNHGEVDYWVVKLTGPELAIKWQMTLGGNNWEQANTIKQTTDGGYIVAGYTISTNGQVAGNHGSFDYWVVKLSPEPVGVNDLFTQAGNLEVFPNPASSTVSLSISSEEPSFDLIISDLMGRKISQQTVSNGGRVDVSTLDNGLYLLTATTPSGKAFSNKFRKT